MAITDQISLETLKKYANVENLWGNYLSERLSHQASSFNHCSQDPAEQYFTHPPPCVKVVGEYTYQVCPCCDCLLRESGHGLKCPNTDCDWEFHVAVTEKGDQHEQGRFGGNEAAPGRGGGAQVSSGQRESAAEEPGNGRPHSSIMGKAKAFYGSQPVKETS